jgi:hypothetical protein
MPHRLFWDNALTGAFPHKTQPAGKKQRKEAQYDNKRQKPSDIEANRLN